MLVEIRRSTAGTSKRFLAGRDGRCQLDGAEQWHGQGGLCSPVGDEFLRTSSVSMRALVGSRQRREAAASNASPNNFCPDRRARLGDIPAFAQKIVDGLWRRSLPIATQPA